MNDTAEVLSSIKTGVDKVLADQAALKTSIDEVKGDYVPRKDLESTREWVKQVEAKANDLVAHSRTALLPAIPERLRGLSHLYERSGLPEQKAIERAALEAWVKLFLTLQYPQRRPDLSLSQVRSEIPGLISTRSPVLTWLTPAPTASTTPAPSAPTMWGN